MVHALAIFPRRLVCALLIALLASSCSTPVDDSDRFGTDNMVHVTLDPSELVVTNHTRMPVYTRVLGQQVDNLLYWRPSLEGPRLKLGDSMHIPYDDLNKMDDDEEIIVYWWHADVQNRKWVPGEMQSVVVAL